MTECNFTKILSDPRVHHLAHPATVRVLSSLKVTLSKILIVLLILAATGLAQTNRPTMQRSPASRVARARLSLGMDLQQVHRVLGVPTVWINLENGKYVNSVNEYRASVEVYGFTMIADVYKRRTSSNLYEIEVAYEYDRSQSRLNPRRRVDRIIFDADKPTTIDKALVDMPELIELCEAGCGIDQRYVRSSYGPSIALIPLEQTARELDEVGYLDEPSAEKHRACVFFEWKDPTLAIAEREDAARRMAELKTEIARLRAEHHPEKIVEFLRKTSEQPPETAVKPGRWKDQVVTTVKIMATSRSLPPNPEEWHP